MCVAVAIVIVADLVEVPEAAVDRKIASPIVLVARERDALARLDLADDVGAAANERREGRLLELVGIDRVFRQYRHQAEDQWKLAVVAPGQIEAYRMRADDLRLDHLGIIEAMVGAAPVAQELPGKDDVLWRHRLAIGKTRGRIEREGDEAARRVGVDRLGDEAVERERLVIAAGHQAFDHLARDDVDIADQWAAHALRHQAARDEGIDALECSKHALNEAAAL